ncbi:MAG: 2-hydroxyacid dehydrogenase [Candidatus Hecatellaceae archaeon]
MDWMKEASIPQLLEKLRNMEEKGAEAEQPPEGLLEIVKDADFLIVHLAPVTSSVIDEGKNLKLIGCLRGGVENINVTAATKRGIIVLNSPGRNADAVADFTLGLILAEARNIVRAHILLKQGIWGSISDFMGSDLRDKILGIIGFGQVGRKVAERAKGFGMKVYVYDPYVSDEAIKNFGCQPVTFEELIRNSDFITIHARLTAETRHLIGEREFKQMKATAYLINTARGPIVDEKALYEALKERRIAGAALDVYEKEPLAPDSPLLTLENITLTPHIAGATKEAFYLNAPRMMAAEVERFLKKEKPQFVVNPEVLK